MRLQSACITTVERILDALQWALILFAMLLPLDAMAALAVVTLPNAQVLKCTYFGAPAFCTGATIPPATPAHVGASYTIVVGILADNGFNIDSSYRGTVIFTSSDAAATLPPPYTFTAADAGVHSFTVTFETLGTQLVTATDSLVPTNDGMQVPVLSAPIVVPAVGPIALAGLILSIAALGFARIEDRQMRRRRKFAAAAPPAPKSE